MNRDQIWILTLAALLLVCFWAGLRYQASFDQLDSELQRRQRIVETATKVTNLRMEASQFLLNSPPDPFVNHLAVSVGFPFSKPVPDSSNNDRGSQTTRNCQLFELQIPDYKGTMADCVNVVNRITSQSQKLRVSSLILQNKNPNMSRKPGDIEEWTLSGQLKFIAKLPN